MPLDLLRIEMAADDINPLRLLLDAMGEMKDDIRQTSAKVDMASAELSRKIDSAISPLNTEMNNLRDRITKLETRLGTSVSIAVAIGGAIGIGGSWAISLFHK